MKKITQFLMLTACLLFAGYSSAQQLVISDHDACPGTTVPVTVSLEGMPDNLNSFDFTFDFTENVTLSNFEQLLPQSSFTTVFNWNAATSKLTFYGHVPNNLECTADLGVNFDVLSFDLLMPVGATECINTNTLDATYHTSSGTTPCYTQILPMSFDEGKYCPDQVLCDPCCAAPNLYDEFMLLTELSPSGNFIFINACLAPRNNCPNSQYEFEFFEIGPPNSMWTSIPVSGTCTGALQLPYEPGVEYIFRARYVNDLCTTQWTEIDYVVELPCDNGDAVTIGGTISTMGGDPNDCPNSPGNSIAGAEVTITQNGQVICESTTDENGVYGCEVCPGSGTYEVCVTTTCDEQCRLKANDLLRFRKIMLGIISPTQQDYVVGDLNGDGIFSIQELLCLQRYALYLPIGPGDPCYIDNWCAFVPSEEFETPLAYPYDNCITIDADDPDASATDFVRGMIGDLDGDCGDCVHGDGTGPLKVVVLDEGSVLSVKPTKATRPNYLSLEIKLTKNNFQVTHVSGAYDNIQFNQEGELLKIIAISENSGAEVGVNGNLLQIHGQGAVAGTEDQLTLTDDQQVNLLFDGIDGYYLESDTRGGGKRNAEFTKDVEMTLFGQANAMSIYSASEVGNATLMISDLLGRTIHRSVVYLNQGDNQIELTIPTNASGVFIATLVDQNGQLISSEKVVHDLK